jgi:hypothetical protein
VVARGTARAQRGIAWRSIATARYSEATHGEGMAWSRMAEAQHSLVEHSEGMAL